MRTCVRVYALACVHMRALITWSSTSDDLITRVGSDLPFSGLRFRPLDDQRQIQTTIERTFFSVVEVKQNRDGNQTGRKDKEREGEIVSCEL